MKKLIKLSLLAVFLGIHPMGCIKEEVQSPCAGSNFATLVETESFDTHYSKVLIHHDSVIQVIGWVDFSEYHHFDEIALSLIISKTKRIAEHTFNLQIGNEAYACSPPIPKVDNPISKIDIIYNGDSLFYNSSFGTLVGGDTISDLFEYSFYGHNYNEVIKPIKIFLPQEQYENEELTLKVASANSDLLTLNFDVLLTDSNGKSFEFKKQTFNLR
ncbi:hypothetical protein [Owenweeksia hongkongensis]|uniref:hypothetical protein n=1 Tax=Owenweeksia hongkongensis TaxID=253245 RepID=UPI003A8F65C2